MRIETSRLGCEAHSVVPALGGLVAILLTAVPLAAAQLVGIDDVQDRIVSIDTATGEVETLVASEDVRADRVFWSPDESFAYLLDSERDRVLVYDAELGEIVRVLSLPRALDVQFSADSDRAYVAGCATAAIDTRTHSVVDHLPPNGERFWRDELFPWLVGEGRVYSVYDRYFVSILNESAGTVAVHPLADDVVGLALGNSGSALYAALHRYVSVRDARDGEENGRLYFRGPIRKIVSVPEMDRLVVVSDEAIVLLSQEDSNNRKVLSIDSLRGRHRGGGDVLFSGDRTTFIVPDPYYNEVRAYSVEDGRLLWEAASPAAPAAVSQDGYTVLVFYQGSVRVVKAGQPIGRPRSAPEGYAAWRERDRSFYVVSEHDFYRVDSSSGERHDLFRSAGFSDLAVGRDGRVAFTEHPGSTIYGFELDDPALAVETLMDAGTDSIWFRDLNWLPGRGLVAVITPEEYVAQIEIVILDESGASFRSIPGLAGLYDLTPLSSETLVGTIDYSRVAAFGVDGTGISEIEGLEEGPYYDWGFGIDAIPEEGVAFFGANHEKASDYYQASLVRYREEGGIDASWSGPLGWPVQSVAAVDDARAFVAVRGNRYPYEASRVLLLDLDDAVVEATIGVPGLIAGLHFSREDGVLYVVLEAEQGILVVDPTSQDLFGPIGQGTQLSNLHVANAGGESPRPSVLRSLVDVVPMGDVVAVARHGGQVVVATGLGVVARQIESITNNGKALAVGPKGDVVIGVYSESGPLLAFLDRNANLRVAREVPLPAGAMEILWSRDSTLIYVLLATGVVAVVDFESGHVLNTLPVGRSTGQMQLTPDGVLALNDYHNNEFVFIDGVHGSVTRADMISGPRAVSAGGLFVAARGVRGEEPGIWRVDPVSGRAELLLSDLVNLGHQPGIFASSDGKSVAILSPDTCGGFLQWIDGESGEVVAGTRLTRFSEIGGLSHDGDRAYLFGETGLEVWGREEGRPIAQVNLPKVLDWYDARVAKVAVGCEACAVSVGKHPEWDSLPTWTPTRTPVPTPTLKHEPRVEEDGYWFSISSTHAASGEVVEVRVWTSADYYDRLGAVQMDLRFPDELKVVEWRDGQPDCEFDWHDEAEHRYSYTERTRFAFVPAGCEPLHDCTGVRSLVTKFRSYNGMFRCRVRIAEDAATGVYEIRADNLLIRAEEPAQRLQVVPGHIAVRADASQPTPTPTHYVFRDPTAPPAPALRLQGSDLDLETGTTTEVSFFLAGSAQVPFRGDVSARIFAEQPLRFVSNEAGNPACHVNRELYGAGSFRFPLPACVRRGCGELSVTLSPNLQQEDGADDFYTHSPEWLMAPDSWLFRCEITVDDDAQPGRYLLNAAAARMGSRELVGGEVVVNVSEPPLYWFEIESVNARPGELVDINVWVRSTDYRERAIGVRHELLVPLPLEIELTAEGNPDCGPSLASDASDFGGLDDLPMRTHFEFYPHGCDPDSDCSGVSALAVTEGLYPANDSIYWCRARVESDAVPGVYPVESANLIVARWESIYEPKVYSGTLTVLGSSAQATPTPAPNEPELRRDHQLVLVGAERGGSAGHEFGLGFTLFGGPMLPQGAFSAAVEIPPGVELARDDNGDLRCGSSADVFSQRAFYEESIPCDTGLCRVLTVSISIGFAAQRDWDESISWLQGALFPIFECRYRITGDAEPGRRTMAALRATLDGRSIATLPGVVHVHPPPPTPMPTWTPLPTLSSVPAYECEPRAEGRSILCVNNIDADPGQRVDVSVRFRSGGLEQAGVEFEIVSDQVEVLPDPARLIRSGRVLCHVNPATGKEATAINRIDSGAVKAIVFSVSNLDPIPDGVELIRCEASAPQAPGIYEIRLENADGSDKEGEVLPLDVRSGFLRVRGEVPTPTVAATSTGAPSLPPTPTRGLASRQIDLGFDVVDAGCHIGPPRQVGGSIAAFFALLLGLALANARRRGRLGG